MAASPVRSGAAVVTAAALFATLAPAGAQEAVTLRETHTAGAQFAVSSRVEVTGTLTLPLEKGETTPRTLNVTGSSAVDYHERLLTIGDDKQVSKTIRVYKKLEFQRKVGDQPQQSALRPEVRRLVVLRHNQVEVPFSPDGPMTWNELDMIRTDVFAPALTGLLAEGPVKVGDTWKAAAFAVQELTDLDRIDEGGLTCKLEQLATVAGRKHARIGFTGSVRGIGEDGPTKHALDGYLFFDLEANHVSYVSMTGVQHMLDKDGKTIGKIEGTFVLTRRPEQLKELSDAALAGVKLEPSEENTQLLYDNPEMGVKFLHPRRWRVAGVRGPQIALDENAGHGLLMTVEPLKQIPTAMQFLQESKGWLEQQKAKILKVEQPKQIQAGPRSVEQFSLEVDISGQKVLMVYLVLRQGKTGATVAARVLPQQQALILQDIERIAKSVQLP
jgi:hypothetical protein